MADDRQPEKRFMAACNSDRRYGPILQEIGHGRPAETGIAAIYERMVTSFMKCSQTTGIR